MSGIAIPFTTTKTTPFFSGEKNPITIRSNDVNAQSLAALVSAAAAYNYYHMLSSASLDVLTIHAQTFQIHQNTCSTELMAKPFDISSVLNSFESKRTLVPEGLDDFEKFDAWISSL